jgi:hypothetical protein
MITLKEKKMLLRMKTALGEQVDDLRAEIEQEEALLAQQSEQRITASKNILSDLFADLNKVIAEDKKRTAEQQTIVDQLGKMFSEIAADPEVPEEFKQQLDEVDEPKPVKKTLVDKAVSQLKETAPSMFVQPEPPTTGRDIQAIQSKLKLLEGWVSKISMAGPGGGEVLFRYLDDVNRNTMTTSNDNWVLEYDAATKKVQFTEDVGPIRTLKFNLEGSQTPLIPGQSRWNPIEDCLETAQADGSVLQHGFEHYIQVYNDTGATLTNGTVVQFTGVRNGSSNPVPTVGKYTATALTIPLYLIGVMTNDVPNGQYGRVTVFGKVRDINTTGSTVGETWSYGDLLWAHPSLPGQLTKVRPSAPNVATSVAAVMRADSVNGVLLVRPTIWPRQFYGDWYDTTNQHAATPNTAYKTRFNSTGAVSGFELVNGTDIKALNSGRYNFEFSYQFTSSNSSLSRIYIWYRFNGVDVPHSATVITIAARGGKSAPSWNFPVLMEPNDTFTLMWATDSTAVSIAAEAATSFCPSIPSVILTVSQTNL